MLGNQNPISWIFTSSKPSGMGGRAKTFSVMVELLEIGQRSTALMFILTAESESDTCTACNAEVFTAEVKRPADAAGYAPAATFSNDRWH